MFKSKALVGALSALFVGLPAAVGLATVGLMVSGFASTAQADASTELYHCVFTTGYVEFSYNTDGEELYTYRNETIVLPNGSVQEVPHIESDVKLEGDPNTELKMVNRNGTTLFTLTLTNTAYDGMSDAVYPYSVVANTARDSYAGHIGACYSTSKPKLRDF